MPGKLHHPYAYLESEGHGYGVLPVSSSHTYDIPLVDGKAGEKQDHLLQTYPKYLVRILHLESCCAVQHVRRGCAQVNVAGCRFSYHLSKGSGKCHDIMSILLFDLIYSI